MVGRVIMEAYGSGLQLLSIITKDLYHLLYIQGKLQGGLSSEILSLMAFSDTPQISLMENIKLWYVLICFVISCGADNITLLDWRVLCYNSALGGEEDLTQLLSA